MTEKPSNPTDEILIKSLMGIAVESWRLGKLFERLLNKLDAGEQGRYRGQYRWFQRKVEESLADAGMNIVNVEGQPFDPGMAATPVNIEEFSPDDQLVVEQMVEPIIMGSDGIVKTGTVTLRRVQS